MYQIEVLSHDPGCLQGVETFEIRFTNQNSLQFPIIDENIIKYFRHCTTCIVQNTFKYVPILGRLTRCVRVSNIDSQYI